MTVTRLRRLAMALAGLAMLPGLAMAESADAGTRSLAALAAALPAPHAVIVARGGVTLLADVPRQRNGRALRWRWASQTKQLVAVLVMQQVAAGRIDLDAPLRRYLPTLAADGAGQVTVRQLLRHQSGLPNPDDVPSTAAQPSGFYSQRATAAPLAYCTRTLERAPGGNWVYNNCDYIVAGALLQAVTGQSWPALVRSHITAPLGLRSVSAGGADLIPASRLTVSGQREDLALPDLAVARFGAAAALAGSPGDLVRFDQALLDGKLLPAAARETLWAAQAESGYVALGQWVFPAQLAGCTGPVRIVERRGAIGGMQLRNFILPDKKVIAVVFVSHDSFEFGEIWQGKGFSYELLSKAACP